MQCPHCGNRLLDGFRFCHHCGKAALSAPPPALPEDPYIAKAAPEPAQEETPEQPEQAEKPDGLPEEELVMPLENAPPEYTKPLYTDIVPAPPEPTSPPPEPAAPSQENQVPENAAPFISDGRLFLLELLCYIPVVNIIVLAALALSGKNPARVKLARMKLLAKLVVLLAVLIAALTVIVLIYLNVIPPLYLGRWRT